MTILPPVRRKVRARLRRMGGGDGSEIGHGGLLWLMNRRTADKGPATMASMLLEKTQVDRSPVRGLTDANEAPNMPDTLFHSGHVISLESGAMSIANHRLCHIGN